MSLTGSLNHDELPPLTGQLEPVTPLAPLSGELEQEGGPPLDLAGLRALIEGATDAQKAQLREALEIPEIVTPDPLEREDVLTLLADLSDEERSELGIIDPVAPDPLERADVLTLLADLSEEEREGLGIPEGGEGGSPSVSYEDAGAHVGEYTPEFTAAVNTVRFVVKPGLTLLTGTDIAPGTVVNYVLVQDDAGGRVPSFVGYLSPSGVEYNLDPQGTTIISFVFDGSDWLGLGSAYLFTNPGSD